MYDYKGEARHNTSFDTCKENSMFRTHRTAEEREMSLAQMTDTHLVNTIKAYFKPIIEAKFLANLQKKDQADPLLAALYDIPELDVKALANKLVRTMYFVQPYLTEAYLRGLEEPRLIMIEALGRSEAFPSATLLEGQHIEIDTSGYEKDEVEANVE